MSPLYYFYNEAKYLLIPCNRAIFYGIHNAKLQVFLYFCKDNVGKEQFVIVLLFALNCKRIITYIE